MYRLLLGGIAFSSNYGSNWQMSSSADTTNTNWNAASCDSTGQYFHACSDKGVHRSTDYGATWTQILSSTDDHRGMTSCSQGRYLATVAYGSSGTVKVSSDYGSTWTNTFSVAYGYSLASDSSGRNLAVGCHPGYIHQSDDYGQSFRVVNPVTAYWPTIFMTSAGK